MARGSGACTGTGAGRRCLTLGSRGGGGGFLGGGGLGAGFGVGGGGVTGAGGGGGAMTGFGGVKISLTISTCTTGGSMGR
jgi:hypothetical protein